MNDAELNKLLQTSDVPERDMEYWEHFPKTVSRRIRQAERHEHIAQSSRWSQKLLLGLGFAAVCLVVGIIIGWQGGYESGKQRSHVIAMQKYYQEIKTLFPKQLQAIIIDGAGPRLLLSETADVPSSLPVLFTIQKNTEIQNIITFSGQQIHVNGDLCDVLADGDGNILLIGKKLAWSSKEGGSVNSPYSIHAQYLASLP